jgi:hypothetical protein
MRIPTPNQWRFEGLAESVAQMVRRDPDLLSQPGMLEEFLLHAFDKVYAMGQSDPASVDEHVATGVEIGLKIARPVVPVTDLSDIPEVFERAKDRWRDGSCH